MKKGKIKNLWQKIYFTIFKINFLRSKLGKMFVALKRSVISKAPSL